MNSLQPLDLGARAHRAMCEAGFVPDFPPTVLQETQALEERAVLTSAAIPDLRSLKWSSIDNVESRDLDQIEVAEELPTGEIRVSVGIADVDSFVPKGCATDVHAASNATSVYTGVATFPMFPPEISNDLTSLLENRDRLAVVVDFNVAKNGRVSEVSVRRGLVRNEARLDYESVGAWLEDVGTVPRPLAAVPWIDAQLLLQDEAAKRLHEERIRAGALEFESIEPRPVMEHGDVVGLAVQRKTRARTLIENFMVAANTAIATFIEARGWPSIQRVVRTPERWSRIVALAAERGEPLPEIADSRALAEFLARSRHTAPEQFADLSLAIVKLIGAGEYVVVRNAEEAFGHFGLAVHDYAHATAPNRRYPDLIMQRLLKAALAGEQCPYTSAELEQIAARCNERGSAARKVERQMRKVAAASFLSSRIGEIFDAIVTGSSKKGTYARVTNPPVEGRVVRGAAAMDVGDKIRVRLVATDAEAGFIDFAREG